MTQPWGKFFWSDYAGDPALKLCSLAAQGLWMRMLCTAAEHDPVGYVAINNEPLDDEAISCLVGKPISQVSECLAELERRGVFSRDRRGWIYSRRMKNDAKKRDIAAQNGKKGGNPNLRKQRENSGQDKQWLNGEHKGDGNPHIPEARVQNTTDKSVVSAKRSLPIDFEPEEFASGTQCRQIVDSWPRQEFERQLESFRAHHQREGSKFVNWQAAWKTWALNSERFQRKSERPTGRSNDLVESILAENGLDEHGRKITK